MDRSASSPTGTGPDPSEAPGMASSTSKTTTTASGTLGSAGGSVDRQSQLTSRLRRALRQFPDFPKPGILFEDFLPIFRDPALHADLLDALEAAVRLGMAPSSSSSSSSIGDTRQQKAPDPSTAIKPDLVVGLESRGFLFGPSLALRLGIGFVPVRKAGKLPGPVASASFEKEYGQDRFEMQRSAIEPGQRVVIVDDLIATGGSASAAGQLVKQLGGLTVLYLFIIELDFLKGRDLLDAPVYTLLSSQS